MEERKKIKQKEGIIITIILWIICAFLWLCIYVWREINENEIVGIIFLCALTLIVLIIFINRILKKYQNLKRKNRAIKYWIKKELRITGIEKTGYRIWWEWEKEISSEYIIKVEDENQIYISSGFYAKNIDDYAKVWDYITVYALNWERLNYYVDLKSIKKGEWKYEDKKKLKENKNKICESAERNPFWEWFTIVIIWVFLALMWWMIVFNWEIFWVIFVIFGWLMIFWKKSSWKKYKYINEWEEVKWTVDSIEETKVSWSMSKYIVNAKANWRIYKSEELIVKPELKKWDKVYIYIDRNNYDKYCVYVNDNTKEYYEEKWKKLNENIQENPAAFYIDPLKVIKESYTNDEDDKNNKDKEQDIEKKFPYLKLEPKRKSIFWILINNISNWLIWFIFSFIWVLITCWWDMTWLIILIPWLLVLYPVARRIYELHIEEKLLKIWVKKLTKISRIEVKKEIINITTKKKNDKDEESEPKYYCIIYTTDWNNEYKSFKVTNPMVNIWNPLYVYVDPNNEKSYRVDTSNISFDIMDFINKLLWNFFPWMIKN